jgi:hypothetical protein
MRSTQFRRLTCTSKDYHHEADNDDDEDEVLSDFDEEDWLPSRRSTQMFRVIPENDIIRLHEGSAAGH